MEFDLIVLGMGPGSETTAGDVAQAGRAVLGIDERLLGGECPYFGCIPSKMILRGAEVLADGERIPALSGSSQVTPDFAPVHARIRDEATDDWTDTVAVRRFEDQGGMFVRGHGRLAGRADDGRLLVDVGGETHTASAVCIATGTSPAIPSIEGLDELENSVDGPVWTNREVLRTATAPASMIVLGGGVISCELAQGFARYGTSVTVIDGGKRLLPREEPETSDVLRRVFEREGLDLRFGSTIEKIAADGDGVTATLSDGSTVTAEKLLIAAGRTPNLADIGLETVGLDPSAKALDVDEHMSVLNSAGHRVDGLHAVGDVTGKGAFTHVSMWQSTILTAHLLGRPENFGGYDAMAWATFTDPEVGRVGMTEEQARDAGLNVQVGIQQLADNTRGWIYKVDNDGFVKVVADADRGVLVGATVTGPHGGELIAMLTLAVHAAVPIPTLLNMIYVFPTLHRAILEALQALN